MKYFQNIPKDFYQLYDETSLDVITNITHRFKFDDLVKTNGSSFYEYVISDGDTPEILANKIYDSSERHWIILLLNDIVDPVSQWPLSDRSLNLYIQSKYGEEANNSPVVPWSKSNIKTYRKIETRTNIATKEFTKDIIEVDAASYANVVSSTTLLTLESGNIIQIKVEKESQSYFEYEQELNEKKRLIKLLRPEFVSFVEKEFKGLFL
jgi:hypothetical protein